VSGRSLDKRFARNRKQTHDQAWIHTDFANAAKLDLFQRVLRFKDASSLLNNPVFLEAFSILIRCYAVI